MFLETPVMVESYSLVALSRVDLDKNIHRIRISIEINYSHLRDASSIYVLLLKGGKPIMLRTSNNT